VKDSSPTLTPRGLCSIIPSLNAQYGLGLHSLAPSFMLSPVLTVTVGYTASITVVEFGCLAVWMRFLCIKALQIWSRITDLILGDGISEICPTWPVSSLNFGGNNTIDVPQRKLWGTRPQGDASPCPWWSDARENYKLICIDEETEFSMSGR